MTDARRAGRDPSRLAASPCGPRTACARPRCSRVPVARRRSGPLTRVTRRGRTAQDRTHQRHSRGSGNDIRTAQDRTHQRHSRGSGNYVPHGIAPNAPMSFPRKRERYPPRHGAECTNVVPTGAEAQSEINASGEILNTRGLGYAVERHLACIPWRGTDSPPWRVLECPGSFRRYATAFSQCS